MNLLAYILAEKEFGWVQIVVVAIFFLVSIVGSIIQKAKEKQQKDPARKPRAESGQRQTGRSQTVQAVRPRPPVAPPAYAAEQTVRVSDELRLRQQRQTQLDSDRQKRLASRKSPESDTNAIEARMVSVHPDEADTAPMQISKVGSIAGLRTLDDARQAMILHEIFSPPKALRKGGEMWDT